MNEIPATNTAPLVLFEGLQPFHDLGKQERLVLEKALPLLETLHQQGEVNKRKVVSVAQNLVESQEGEDLGPEERRQLAAVLAIASGPVKESALETLGLSPNRLRQARALAALLKLGKALSPDGSVLSLKEVERTPVGLWVQLKAPPPEAGTPAAPKAAAALAAAQEWDEAGYAPLYLMETGAAGPQGRAQNLPAPRSSPGLLATDTLQEAGRKIWRQHLAEMLRKEPGTRQGDVEALHDMRVATRRMRAAFDVFGPFFKSKAIRPIQKELRMAGRALGKVRDLDVLQEHAQAYLEALPPEEPGGLDPLLDTWREQREAAREDLLAYLSSQDYHEFIWDFNAFLQEPEAEDKAEDVSEIPEPNRVREVAPVLIYTRLGEVRAYERILEHASMDQLHALRIEFKRLRYCLEFFREGMGEEAKSLIDTLKKLQDHLGELHDAQVSAGLIQDFLAGGQGGNQPAPADSTPYAGQPNLAPVAAYLASRYADRHRLLEAFPTAWESFNSLEFRRKLALAIAEL